MRNIRIILTALLMALTTFTSPLKAQVEEVGLRSNIVSWALLSPSLGIDIAWNGHYRAIVDGSYGDWDISSDSNRAARLSSIGVEGRRYFHAGDYLGWYVGLDARYLRFHTRKSKTDREGNLLTAGVLVGYTFRLNDYWSIDTGIGAGYVHSEYDKSRWYPPAQDFRGLGVNKRDGLGLTHLSVSLAYRFKL